MSRAGYADFFPAAPSVLAKKKAAEEKARRRQHDEYERDSSGSLSATSISTTTTISNGNSNLTPSTSNSSPPAHASPSTKVDITVSAVTQRDHPSALLTPKATPPAAAVPLPAMASQVKPDPTKHNMRIKYDPMLEKGEKGRHPLYRLDGEGVTEPIVDPRLSIRDYTQGPKKGKKQVRHNLGRVKWQWDQYYIGPGPPNQILLYGMSPLTTESEVLMNFRSFGEVQTIEMKVDPTTSGSLGVCSIVYRDGKDGRLGHQSARTALQKGNGMVMGMTKVHVELDRDGFKCSKIVDSMLERKYRKEEETRKMEQKEAAKRHPPPVPQGPASASQPPRSPSRIDPTPIRDHDSRFSKPRPPGFNALEEVKDRPAVFISVEHLPDEQRLCKHLYGRLRNFGVLDVISDESGFFVIFGDIKGMERCFRMCDGDRLFTYQMWMKRLPHGNPQYKPPAPPEPEKKRGRSRSVSQESSSKRKRLEPIDPLEEASSSIVKELRTSLVSDLRKRIADVFIYEALDPQKLSSRKRSEEELLPKIDTDASSSLNAGSSSTTPLSATIGFNKSVTGVKTFIGALPKFKKRVVKRQETPTSDASPIPLPNGHRRKASKEDARPLAHRLNHYDMDGSDDESYATDHRAMSRAMSTDDDASVIAPEDRRKRKRSMGAHTPSRLKDTTVSTDDEDEGDREQETPQNEEETPDHFIVEDSEEEEDARRSRKKTKVSKTQEVPTPSDSEDDENRITSRVPKRSISPSSAKEHAMDIGSRQSNRTDENDIVDVCGIDTDVAALLPQPSSLPTPMEIDMSTKPPVLRVPVDLSWTISTTGTPQPSVEDDDDIIMDLDGLQHLLKDDEDHRFLQLALQSTKQADIGNVHAYACRLKEVKAANRQGQRGVVRTPEKIEGFYRPNPTGCARTEGYRKIPEPEKSMYLPHRLAVAAKRANAGNATAETSSSTSAIPSAVTKPVSSSRMNRVNNRRLVAELNNQKQILSGDAVVMRFNQLKKRKKPVKFARSAIHNWGLYAMENISANDMIIEYVGEIVRQQVADIREKKYLKSGIGSSYLFRIDENTVIDATKKGGIARFINHSCTPNCTAKIIKVEGTKRIVIYALRDIHESEELTYDYKFEREVNSDDRIPCLCGSSGCKGFLN
ncbi:hypothetical protein EDC01DRAFT_77270 [Geopyxis carbonaria]|nr:hypothetical protein EDC01DRAFT_77270 [Geopyxis carbonaria]